MNDVVDPCFEAATVQRDTDQAVWFQRVAVAYDMPRFISDDAVATGENGRGVEKHQVGGESGQLIGVGGLVLLPRVANPQGKRINSSGMSFGLRAAEQ